MAKSKIKTGFTCGSFDLLHAGHVVMLEECASVCDKLIVGLQVDPSIERSNKNKPIQSLVERYIQLKAVKFVDKIIPYQYESELEQILKAVNIDVRIIGSDWEGKDFTGKNLIGETHKIVYNKRQHSFSSSELRKRIKESK
jgi:glycerol-3-phosphate cytidylyltransferase